jgi:FkbM family methyltransferase
MKSLAKSLSYRALDFATGGRGIRRVIAGEPVRWPARWSRYYAADYEPGTFGFLRAWCRPGDTVLDVGAHIGLFTVCMSRLVGPAGRVLSFEPTPSTCHILRETVRMNFCESNVEVHEEAVSKRSGRGTLFDTRDVVSNANSLVRTRRSKGEISVEIVSIDEVVPREGVRLLKIDVEGAELDVLRGAGRTFATSVPAVYLGLHPSQIREAGGTLEEIWELLRDYRMEIFHNHESVDKPWFCDRNDLFEVQALPSSRPTWRGARLADER